MSGDKDTLRRLRVTLEESIPMEQAFLEKYRAMPRTRGQEFLRSCLLKGFLMKEAEEASIHGVLAHQAGEVGGVASAGAVAWPAKPGKHAEPPRPASPVKGFFGENES